MKQLRNLVTAGIVTIGVASAASSASAETEMRCSHQYAPSYPISIVIEDWARNVERLSGGELKVIIFGADSLVKANDNIAAVAKGTVECAFSTNFQWGKTLPVMSVTARPFSMPTLDVWKAFPTSELAQFLEEKLEQKGVKNVAWLYASGRAVFTSNRRYLVSPGDFQGIKIRGFNAQFDAGLAALGAIPVTLPGSETYQALSTGIIDAGMTDITTAYTRKFYEVQDHMVASPVLSAAVHGYVNPKFYVGLSDKAKSALAEAGKIAALESIEKTAAAADAVPGELQTNGVSFREATPEEVQALEAIMVPAFDTIFLEDAGADGEKALELISKLK